MYANPASASKSSTRDLTTSSHTMGFTMVDPPGIVRRESILHKMFSHVVRILHFPVCTFVVGTQN
jgi:hypothetical protein